MNCKHIMCRAIKLEAVDETINKGTPHSIGLEEVKQIVQSLVIKNNLKICYIEVLLVLFKRWNADELLQITTDRNSTLNSIQNKVKKILEVLNKLQNESDQNKAIRKMTLNFERNLKEKLKVDNSDSVINERTILLDSLKGRDGTYKKEELELIISDIEKSLTCEDFDDDKDDVSNDVEARHISKTLVKANDTMIEMKQVYANSTLFYKPAEFNITSVRVNYDIRDISPTSNAYFTHRAGITKIFEKFGSIKNIQFISMAARCFKKNGQLLQLISDHKLYTIRVFIDYHSPISAKRAFSLNGRCFGESDMTVCYDSDVPVFLLNNRKCVYLSHLPRDIDNNTIWKLFSTCGEIEYVYLVRDEKLGYVRGIGCIVFITEVAVKKALELNGTLLMDSPIIVKDCSSQFWEINVTRPEEETTEIEKVLAKDKKRQNLPHKSNSNNPSKKFKNNSEEAVVREAKTEKKKQEFQKRNVGIVKNKPSTSFQGKTTNFEQKKNNKKFNKQKKQMAKKLAAKPNKPAKV